MTKKEKTMVCELKAQLDLLCASYTCPEGEGRPWSCDREEFQKSQAFKANRIVASLMCWK